MADGPDDDEGHGAPALLIQCEVCFRELLEDRFPRCVLVSIDHHFRFPEVPRRRTIWSCKECRAQEVAHMERIAKFINFRLYDT